MTVLLDTHVLLWWSTDPSRLSARAAREIARAKTIYVSPSSFFEIATLVRHGRIRLDRALDNWIDDVLASDSAEIAALTPAAAGWAGLLGNQFPGDPVDRMLYSTAREMVVPLVTKDRRLQAFARDAGDVRAIW